MDDFSLGKSSLSIQFVEGQFVDSYDPTIENSKAKFLEHFFREYLIKLNENYVVGI